MIDVETLVMREWGNLPNFQRRRGKDEWHSACPSCGSSDPSKSDRWMMTAYLDQQSPTISGYCRQCEHIEYVFLDSDGGKIEAPGLTSAELKEMREHHQKQREAKEAKARDTLEWHAAHISEWHDTMTAEQRELWHRHWIDDWTIDRFQLGFTRNKVIGYEDDRPVKREALVLPIWEQGWHLSNIQWRIIEAENGDKYRQVAGLPPGLFQVYPDMPLNETIIVTEGVKKALCLNQVTRRATGEMQNIVAVNNSNPGDDLLIRFEQVNKMYLILDPDARDQDMWGDSVQKRVVARTAMLNPRIEIFPINIPTKLDDFFYEFGASYDDFLPYMDNARPVVRAKDVQYVSIAQLFNKE